MKNICLLLTALATLVASAEEWRINVSSDEVEYDTDGTGAVFRGNVEISAGALTLWAATLHVQSNNDNSAYIARSAGNTPLSVVCGDCADYMMRAEVGEQAVFNSTLQRLRLEGGILICADEGCRRGTLQAATADWDQDKRQMLLTGAPIVSGSWRLDETPASLTMQAKQVRYHFDRSEAVLTGDARLTRDESEIAGAHIEVNLKTGALRAKADPDSRVQATFGGND